MITPPTDADLERLLRDSRDLQDPPAHVLHRAIGLWDRPAAAPTLLQRLTAILSFDSAGADPLAFGLRSAGNLSRQMLYSCEGRDIDIRVSGPRDEDGGWDVRGQLLGPDAGGEVELMGEEEDAPRRAGLNELTEFHFAAVPGGRYRLTLILPGAVIHLPEFSLPAGLARSGAHGQ